MSSVHSAPRVVHADDLVDRLRALIGGDLLALVEAADEITLVVARDALIRVMEALRDGAQYQQLMEIAGVDYPDRPERFELVYHLLSVTKNHRVRVKVGTDEATPVPSVTGLWPVAGWLEREVFDMYGVVFSGNTDLRRILTDYGFAGHPQRKDFPLTGFVELRYSEEDKRVVYEPVRLAQDFRNFDFMSPWEGAQYVLPGDEKAKAQEQGAPTPAPAAPPPPKASEAPAPKVTTPKTTEHPGQTGAGKAANVAANAQSAAVKKPRGPRKTAAQKLAEAGAKPAPKPRATRKKSEDKA
jgi:NADH-quinone oxidoreductase subunit C